MIKFFRKIRQQLLTDSKTGRSTNHAGRYLLYAIGEIALVVIGILIALQINNWNEYKKEARLEDQYLKKISINIEDDINQYDTILVAQQGYRSQIDSFLKIVRNPNNYETSELDPYFSSLWRFERFTPNKSALNNLISSGKINIIQNESLLNFILDYYKAIEEQSNGVDEALSVYSRNQLGPYIMSFDFMDSKALTSEHRKRKTLLEYHKDPVIENLISARLLMTDIQKAYYEDQIKNAKKLVYLISEELE